MSATAAEVAAELAKLGLHAEVLPADGKFLLADGVNIWIDPHDRYPAATAYAPRPAVDDDWVWGSSFQWGAHRDDDAETVAAKISATLPTGGQS